MKRKYITLLSAASALLLCLAACAKEEGPAATSETVTTTTAVGETAPAPADAALYIIENKKSQFFIVRPDECSDALQKSASKFHTKIPEGKFQQAIDLMAVFKRCRTAI